MSEYQKQFGHDLEEIALLQDVFDRSLGINTKNKLLSYNPVLERWQFEQSGVIDLENFKLHEFKQLDTALRERLFAEKSPVTYSVDANNNLHNEYLPKEAFILVLERGLVYREANGSQESEREAGELTGFAKIQERLLNEKIELGSKMIVISGPGIVEKTAYTENYVDIYEKEKNAENKIVIKMSRMTSNTDYSKYMKQALFFNPNYFDGFEGPIDAWFLANPISVKPQESLNTPEEIFERMFEKKKGTLKESEFQKILTDCMPLIVNYINILCSDKFEPKEVAIAFNAILNKADHSKRNSGVTPISFRNTREEVAVLGRLPVEMVFAGCGISLGFALNSVSKFGMRETLKCVHCPFCNGTVDAEIYGGEIHCLSCKNKAPFKK